MKRTQTEPVMLVANAFRQRVFTTAPGVRLTWEALSVGMRQLNERHDVQPLRRITERTSA